LKPRPTGLKLKYDKQAKQLSTLEAEADHTSTLKMRCELLERASAAAARLTDQRKINPNPHADPDPDPPSTHRAPITYIK